ncbi:MAG: DUF1460 domain-containing protein [Prevotella sp.]|nr:DUF1460 domain-containing protein [Prevotella sp.]
MKKHLLACLTLAIFTTGSSKAQSVYYKQEDSIRVMNLLKQGAEHVKAMGQTPTNNEMMMFYGHRIEQMNVPYVAHTLEPFDKERLIINLREMDCTTFVENVTALTLCTKDKLFTFEAFCHILQKLRYAKGDVPSYIKRLHYFTQWIDDNSEMGFCKELQSPNPPFTAVQTVYVDYMTKNSNKYRMLTVNPGDIPEITKMEKTICGKKYRYIPISQIKNTTLMRQTVHDGDIIAIITNVKGLDTQHIAIAKWHEDGLHILHASSVRHRVVDEPVLLQKYLINRKTTPGIRVVRLI